MNAEINEQFIEDIISQKTSESEILEFKNFKFENGKFNSLKTNSVNKLLKEICAFANTEGGTIILGIAEDENHNPIELIDTCVTEDGFETWEQSFRNLIATKTIPTVYGIKLQHIEVEGKNVIAIKVPKSFVKPHAYYDGEHKFAIRNGNESRPMRYPELKNNFIALEANQQKIIRFRDERVSRILDGELDDNLAVSPSLILHIYPEQSLDTSNYVDLKKYEYNPNIDVFYHQHPKSQIMYNANGLFKARINYEKNISSYIQVFNNGVLESGEIYLMRPYGREHPNLIGEWEELEYRLSRNIYNYCIEFNKLEDFTSFYIYFSLLNVKGCTSFTTDPDYNPYPIKQKIVKSPIIQWSIDETYEEILYPLFTSFANIFGAGESSLYDNKKPKSEKFDYIRDSNELDD